ncbi:MAG: LLM class F420-dependent oxidoreductase [Myxococcota bacterium]|nr:LLM class F420-dependent oxidoreductase [Deltaproteobacteria bacterium]MCP4242871.1 LLM class F420-dependent oxidoreductase [bacterium]MDP6075712.1 LLM class F420-dependent oxidoreductase [Myxococcota bacterium]MDP6243339.1 LLM class F420-dependent oxidoreductase [Myxococcota bacterium]MDP7075456.1 LLM class F420-dependent oxidoreductase [Myxococcota bacterium]
MKFCVSLAFTDLTHYVETAKTAEEYGWNYAVVSDHVVHPEKIATPYPYTHDGAPRWESTAPWPDPIVAIAAMASATHRLRFMTSVFVLPLRNPFLVAKAVGTTSLVSGNRLTLGIGAGWMEDEFRLMDQDFRCRGRRMDEMIDVMRKLWTGEMVEHRGEFYPFDRLQMSPGLTEPVPIWSGGISEAALRRVGRVTDGWISDLHSTEELRELIGKVRRYRADAGRGDEPLPIVGACTDAVGVDGIRRLEEIGVTHLLTLPWVFYGLDGQTLEGKKEGLRRFAEDVIAAF